MKYGGFIFDLDGTLLNTLEDLAYTTNMVLSEFDFPLHETEAYRYLVGNGLKSLFEKATPDTASEKDIMRCCIMFSEVYDRTWHRKTRPYPGINEMLYQLKACNAKLAVLSNKPDRFTQVYMSHFWPDNTFDFGFGQRNNIPKKPDPAGVNELAELMGLSKKQLVYIGDSSVDMQTGKNSGVFTVGVSWGFRSIEELRQHGADSIIEDPMELLQYAGNN